MSFFRLKCGEKVSFFNCTTMVVAAAAAMGTPALACLCASAQGVCCAREGRSRERSDFFFAISASDVDPAILTFSHWCGTL